MRAHDKAAADRAAQGRCRLASSGRRPSAERRSGRRRSRRPRRREREAPSSHYRMRHRSHSGRRSDRRSLSDAFIGTKRVQLLRERTDAVDGDLLLQRRIEVRLHRVEVVVIDGVRGIVHDLLRRRCIPAAAAHSTSKLTPAIIPTRALERSPTIRRRRNARGRCRSSVYRRVAPRRLANAAARSWNAARRPRALYSALSATCAEVCFALRLIRRLRIVGVLFRLRLRGRPSRLLFDEPSCCG